MTSYRLCAHIGHACDCSDVEMQPCLAALIEAYLSELRDGIIRSSNPDAGRLVCFRRREITDLLRTFRSFEALEAFYSTTGGRR
jgi:hypothetical protein